MDKRREKQMIQQAFETSLSGLRDDPWLAQRVMAQAKESGKAQVKGKRKLSVGLVVVIALLLATVTAVAVALLSMREIVEEQAVPIANQYEGDSYTVKDTNLLLQLAEENGIELSDHARNAIGKYMDAGEGYPKEEMLMALAKAEFGDDPGTWTLEQQNWFDDVCVAIGYIQEKEKALPDNAEERKAVILQKAEEYILATYNNQTDLSESRYAIGVQYLDGKVDNAYPEMYWWVNYKPLALEDTEYSVYLTDEGKVWNCNISLGISEGVDYMTVYRRFRQWAKRPVQLWSQAELHAFREALDVCSPSRDKMYLALMKVNYPADTSSAIAQEEAQKIGATALNMSDYTVQSSLYVTAGSNAIWRICYFVTEPQHGGQYFSADIDGETGEVICTDQRKDTNLYYDLVPQSVYDEIEQMETDPSMSVG